MPELKDRLEVAEDYSQKDVDTVEFLLAMWDIVLFGIDQPEGVEKLAI